MAALGMLAMVGAANADETTGLTDTTIKVGVMGPFTGNASSYSKTQIGLMAYFKHINDQGGINGRKFEIVQEDTACDPAKGIAAAKKLVHQDKVFFLHGNSCSGVAMAVKPTVAPTGIPWIIAHAVNPKITMPVNEKKSIFHGVPAGPAYGSTMRKFDIIQEDTACDPAKGIAAAKKLVHQDEVFYLHGNSCSGVAMAVKPTVAPTGIPWIIAHAVNPKITMPVNEKKEHLPRRSRRPGLRLHHGQVRHEQARRQTDRDGHAYQRLGQGVLRSRN